MLDEKEVLGAIIRIKSRIADQEHYLKKCKADPAQVTVAEQFLADLKSRLGFLESDLAKIRTERGAALLPSALRLSSRR